MSRAKGIAGWGLLFSAFALGVIFSQTGFFLPLFAGVFGAGVLTVAYAWLAFGIAMSLVGWANAE